MRSQRIRRDQPDRTVALQLSRRDRGLVAMGILVVAIVDGACIAWDRVDRFVVKRRVLLTRKDVVR